MKGKSSATRTGSRIISQAGFSLLAASFAAVVLYAFGYAVTLVSMAIAYVTAKLSYDLFERRFLNWKSRFATVGL